MQESFQAAQAGQQGPNLPTLNFSLKPGETVNLKLADKVSARFWSGRHSLNADQYFWDGLRQQMSQRKLDGMLLCVAMRYRVCLDIWQNNSAPGSLLRWTGLSPLALLRVLVLKRT